MDHIGYIYACLLAIGGLAGYLKAGSLMSLLMGTLTGLGAGVGAYRASANPGDVYIGLVVSILVAARSVKVLEDTMTTLICFVRFGQAFVKTGQVFPAGVVFGMSLIVFGRYASRLL